MDDTWVVVADGAVARMFKTDAEMLDLAPLRELKNTHHAAANRRGGDRDSSHDAEEERFAKQIASELDQAERIHAFHTVVLAAPPRFLGFLRSHLATGTAKRVGGTVPKDLTGEEVHALAKHLRKALADNHIEDAR